MATATSLPRKPIGAGSASSGRRDPAAPWRHIDLLLILTTLAIASFGVLMVYSATRHLNDPLGLGHNFYYLERQAVFTAIGVGVMVLAAVIVYRWLRDFAPVVLGGSLLVMVGWVLQGRAVFGAQGGFVLER